jgi:hypothetical protein
VKQRLSLSLVSLTIVSSFLACRVDNSGLGVAEMPVLPHDSGAVMGSAGAQGAAGDQGAAGMTSGAGGNTGAGNGGSTGVAGDQGAGGEGAQGAAGDQGSAGNGAAGDQGSAGNGAAGDQGGAGNGAAGTQGAAGNGAAGTQGAAGNGAAGSGGSGGAPAACGPKTCTNGCCDASGKCVAGHANDTCGHGGAACAPCGGCLLCNSSGACEVDPSSTWDVVCDSATIKQTQPNGATWDPHTASADGTNPDPFCQFEMPANTTNPNLGKSSPTVMDSFTPMWNYDVTPSGKPIKASDLMSTAKTWRLWVGDDDGCSAKGCVGQEICEIDQPLEASAFVAGQITRQNLGSCLSVTVKFVCAQ